MNTKEWLCPKCGGLCKREERTDNNFGTTRDLRFWTCMRCGDVRAFEVLADGTLRDAFSGKSVRFTESADEDKDDGREPLDNLPEGFVFEDNPRATE